MLFDFNDTRYLNLVVDNLLDRNVTRNFSDDLNDFFNNSFVRNDSFFDSLELNNLVDNFFNYSVNFDIDILLNDNFLNAVLNDRDLNDLFDLFDPFFDHDLRHDPLDYLRDFDDFLDNTRNDNHFFDYLLNFDNLGNLYHFLDDLFNWNLDLFDSIDMPENLNDLFLYVFDWLRNFDIVVDDLFDFNSLWLTDDDGIPDLNDHWNLPFDDLNHRLFDNLLNFDYSLMDDRHFHDSFNFFWYLFDCLNNLRDYLFNFFNSVNGHDLFNDDLDRIGLFNGVADLDDLLNDLRNFNDSFFPLNNNDRLFNDPVDWDVSNFNMVLNLFSCHHFNFLDDLLHNFLYFNNLWHLNDLLNYLFDIDRNLYNLFHDFFDRNNFFLVDNNLFDFGFNMINHLSHSYWLLNLHNLLNDSFDFVNLGYFSDDFDDSVLDGRNFDGLLNDLFEMNDFILGGWYDDWYFNWNWYFLLDFSDFLDLNNFLNNLFHWNDFRHFNYAVDYLLNNLFNFDDLGNHSEDLQDIIHIDYSHYFLVYHSDDTLINLQSNSSSLANLLEFFEKCLDKDSEVEFNFPGFF